MMLFLAGMMVGGSLGVVIAGMLAAGRNEDEERRLQQDRIVLHNAFREAMKSHHMGVAR